MGKISCDYCMLGCHSKCYKLFVLQGQNKRIVNGCTSVDEGKSHKMPPPDKIIDNEQLLREGEAGKKHLIAYQIQRSQSWNCTHTKNTKWTGFIYIFGDSRVCVWCVVCACNHVCIKKRGCQFDCVRGHGCNYRKGTCKGIKKTKKWKMN